MKKETKDKIFGFVIGVILILLLLAAFDCVKKTPVSGGSGGGSSYSGGGSCSCTTTTTIYDNGRTCEKSGYICEHVPDTDCQYYAIRQCVTHVPIITVNNGCCCYLC